MSIAFFVSFVISNWTQWSNDQIRTSGRSTIAPQPPPQFRMLRTR